MVNSIGLRLGRLVAGALVVLLVGVAVGVSAQGMFYAEESKDGQLYVFNRMAALEAFRKTGEVADALTRPGAGPHGETVVFDSVDALHLYNFKHDRPAEVIAAPEAKKPSSDDGLKVKVGGVILADYTYTSSPEGKDADGNRIHPSSFNVSRTYINVTGQLNKSIQFRITPEVTRETGSGSSLAGSYTTRLKFSYGQYNLDSILGPGSWVRFGQQPTPYVEFEENAYRYRFQGQTFADREGILFTTDLGLVLHANFPGNYGDVMVGYYNGEGYAKAENNDQKAIMARVSVRPVPGGALDGLRVTGFIDRDAYLRDGERDRYVGLVTWESSYLNAGASVLSTKDQTSTTKPEVDGRGWSVWATPKSSFGLEGLLRYDVLKPNRDVDPEKKRTIVGVSYWFPTQMGVSAALMLDYDNVKWDRFDPARKDDRRYALHMLVSF